ncbi:MAG: oxygenase MpaB family protein [Flavobacteriales bacterium]|jgi:hypothetical protein
MNPWRSCVLKRIAALNPEKDHWEIVRLSSFYDYPWDYARALELALFKTFASPMISGILHHSGKFERQTQRRYDDTDILLNYIIEFGLNDPRGRAALERMNFVHSHFPIQNDDYLYVLSTFIFEPRRWVERFGRRQLHAHELRAGFLVWREIGMAMGIKSIPETAEELEAWSLHYEAERFRLAESNTRVSQATLSLLLGWFFPRMVHPYLQPFVLSLFEDSFIQALGFPKPSRAARLITKSALKFRQFALLLLPTRRKPYHRSKRKLKSYPDGYTIQNPNT